MEELVRAAQRATCSSESVVRNFPNEMPALLQIHQVPLTGHHGADQTRRCSHCGEKFTITVTRIAAISIFAARLKNVES
jgi:hypothetical protein